MVVCLCKALSEEDLNALIDQGASNLECLARQCGAGTDCGACTDCLADLLAQRRRAVMAMAGD